MRRSFLLFYQYTELGHAFGLQHYFYEFHESTIDHDEYDEYAFVDWDTGSFSGNVGRNGIMGHGMYQMNHIISVREGQYDFNVFLPGEDGDPSIEFRRTCFGWKYVGDLGLGASISFMKIILEEAGLYKLKIYYYSGENRQAYISVN